MKFKIGDKVVINPIYECNIISHWLKKWKQKPMTIKEYIPITRESSSKWVKVEENDGYWEIKYLMLLYKNFIEEDEFRV